ncbi:hypothetical protein V12B01_21671 [Vibrio splendidus 12B01]|nr:hypothetical protein V12B01_21671 [Vibrio splendidus 12B01]
MLNSIRTVLAIKWISSKTSMKNEAVYLKNLKQIHYAWHFGA